MLPRLFKKRGVRRERYATLLPFDGAVSPRASEQEQKLLGLQGENEDLRRDELIPIYFHGDLGLLSHGRMDELPGLTKDPGSADAGSKISFGADMLEMCVGENLF